MGPEVIGIGAQKCASSWLHAIAGSHPGIGTSDPKEVDFFSYYFDRGYRWYERHFEAAPGTRVCFENSPSYFHDPRAPGRVSAYNSGMKIIVLLRDPIKRAFSNHL
ncbi:MAG: sulfotransferase, partial [Pseudomonadota bacterium]